MTPKVDIFRQTSTAKVPSVPRGATSRRTTCKKLMVLRRPKTADVHGMYRGMSMGTMMNSYGTVGFNRKN